MVSQKHANFLVNTGGATAADIEGLGEEVRLRVHETTGILLDWEIHRVGIPDPRLDTITQDDRSGSLSTGQSAAAPDFCSARAPLQNWGERGIDNRLVTRRAS